VRGRVCAHPWSRIQFSNSQGERLLRSSLRAKRSNPLLLPCCLMDCFAPLAMTVKHASAFPRRSRVRVVQNPSPRKQRAQGKPGARCTRGRAWSVVNTRVSHHRFTGTPGLPCAMVLTASFALSLVTGLSCHHRLRMISANLTPASGRQDHTTSPSAVGAFVKAPSASTASRTNVRDDRDTPL
jgi:hypothetical protein